MKMKVFLAIVGFIVLGILPQMQQAAIFGFISVFVMFYWLNTMKINKNAVGFILLSVVGLLFSYANHNSISKYYLLSELKILMIFTLPVAFYFILKNTDQRKFMSGFFKIFSLLSLCILLYGYFVLGQLRYTGFMDHSIYISAGLSILMSFLWEDVNRRWKFITLVNVLLLGSSSGVIVFFFVMISKLKIPVWKKVIPIVIGMVVSYWYIVDFRGRAILDGGFWEVDRVQIFLSVVYHMIENFNMMNYITGFGIGVQLENFTFRNPLIRTYSPDFVSWFMSFTRNGVYSFSFHNEFLRIFYDYGLIGLILVFNYLRKSLDKTTFMAICLACLTNTIIYSTVGLIVVSLIIATTRIKRTEVVKEDVLESNKSKVMNNSKNRVSLSAH